MPYPAAPCYLIEPTDVVRRWLRRYTNFEVSPRGWTCAAGWHEATFRLPDGKARWRTDSSGRRSYRGHSSVARFKDADPRWPAVCAEGCGYAFTDADERQLFVTLVYRVTAVVPGSALDVGMETTLRDAPPGAMWWADWMPTNYRGFDGRALVCKLPNGSDWPIDMEATNCTRKGDRTHRCWLRHGDPPFVTVDKAGGLTCDAGAGSIASGEGDRYYHGFLRDGILTAG